VVAFCDDNKINEKPKFPASLGEMKTCPPVGSPNEIGGTPGGNSGAKISLWTTVDNLGDKWHNRTVEKL
jgi:hypothetical protein